MNIVISTAVNDDLDFLTDVLFGGLPGESVLLTHRKSTVAGFGRVYKELFNIKAASIKQLYNLPLILRFITKHRASSENVYLMSPNPINIFLMLFCSVLKLRVVSVLHDVDPHYDGVRGQVYSFMNYVQLRFSFKFIVYSEFTKNRVLEQLNALNRNAEIIAFVLRSPVERYKVRAGAKDAEKQYDFVWWGRPEEYKGVYELVDFAKLCEKKQKSLLIVSPLSSYYPDIDRELTSISGVTLCNERLPEGELVGLLTKAKVNLCPYVNATQSGLIPFCAYLGIPSLVYDVGALPEQVAVLNCGQVIESILSDECFSYLDSYDIVDVDVLQKNYKELFGLEY